jgi:SCP-2 sterol transfer family
MVRLIMRAPTRRLVETVRDRGSRRFRRAVQAAGDEGLERLDGRRGRLVVTALFALTPLLVDRRRARRRDGVVEWRITEPDGGASVHTMVFTAGRMRVRRGVVAAPDLTLQLSIADLLRLAAGLSDGVTLVFTGRLRVAGDLDLAFRLPRMLRAP